MIGFDTNILIRYITKDDHEQAQKAVKAIKSLTPSKKGFVCLAVIVECIWVLDSVYGQDRKTISEAVLKLTRSAKLVVQNSDEIETALSRCLSSEGAPWDLADAIISEVGQSFGCEATLTFDKKAAKLEGMRLFL